MMPPMPVNSGPQQQQQQSGPHQQQQQGQPPYPPTVPQPYQQPYAPPSNNQQNQPAYAPMPQPAYGNTAATLGQQSLPQAQPKKSSKVVWIFGGIFIVILLIGCVAIAAFIINNSGKVDSGSAGNKDKNVQVDVDKGKTDPPSHAEVVPTDPNATALDHFNSGFKYYKAKNYTLAASEYRAALQLKPNYPEAEENLGMALYKNHDYPDAIKEFNRAVQLYGGKRSKTYEMLGRTYYNNGQYQDAYNSYLQAVTIDNNDTESMACAGFAAQMGGQTDLAAKIYDKFLEMFPNDRLANYVEAVRTGQQRPPARFEEDD
jgi:tetratricopeptide (TPR) repeat protein